MPGTIFPDHTVQKEFELIRLLLKPYHHILTPSSPTTLARQSVQSRTPSPQSTVSRLQTLHTNPYACSLSGPATFPAGIDPKLRRAIKKLDLCDLFPYTLLSVFASALRRIGAEVEWIQAQVRPKCLFHYNDREARLPFHSILIVTTAQDNQFVIDLTIEQFGYEGEIVWILPLAEYEDKISGWTEMTYAYGWPTFMKDEKWEDERRICEATREVCYLVSRRRYRRMKARKKVGW